MKNYYEILEINENASQEVIERIYKLFAKKYHPDMNMDNPKEAEEKFKEITAAYEVLSNPEKRQKYDKELEIERAKNQKTIEHDSGPKQDNKVSYTPPSPSKKTTLKDDYEYLKEQRRILEDMAQQQAKQQARQEYEMQKAYNDAYYKALEDMGYKIVYKKTFKDYIRILITILVIIAILFALWQIPAFREPVVDLYENSGPIKQIIDSIISKIKG